MKRGFVFTYNYYIIGKILIGLRNPHAKLFYLCVGSFKIVVMSLANVNHNLGTTIQISFISKIAFTYYDFRGYKVVVFKKKKNWAKN